MKEFGKESLRLRRGKSLQSCGIKLVQAIAKGIKAQLVSAGW